jgi:hypothetical protein
MLEILRGTPLWAYAVFFIITYYGVVACFKNYETQRSLKITPTIFIVVSLASLKLSQGLSIPLSVYFLSLLGGCFLALRFYSYHNVALEGKRLVLDGTFKVLLVYWCFFAWRYHSGYQAAMYPDQANTISAVVWSSAGAGLINGLIIGRSLRLLRFFKPDDVTMRSSR